MQFYKKDLYRVSYKLFGQENLYSQFINLISSVSLSRMNFGAIPFLYSKNKHYPHTQSGNIFFTIFAAIALLGLTSAALMSFIKGPLSTSIKLTRISTAQTQMSVAAQVAVMASSNDLDDGDCDDDGVVEPVGWRDASVEPFPSGGGLVPHTIGIQKKDPWGTEYGYCVWNHGVLTSGSGCASNILVGNQSASLPVVALVSAGPDKTFSTICRSFFDADINVDGDVLDVGDFPLVSKSNPADDDIIFSYTYNEASKVAGGLWALKSGDPSTATISKDIEVQGAAIVGNGLQVAGNATVQGTGVFERLAASGSDFLQLLSGLKLAGATEIPVCNSTNKGVMRLNAAGVGLEICGADNTWQSISGAAKAFDTTSQCLVSGDAGKVRYNSSTSQPEFCDGSTWRSFVVSNAAAYLTISPLNTTTLNVDYASSATNTLATYRHSTTNSQVFTVTNTGQTSSAVLNTSVSGSNFEIISNQCNGISLAAMSTCDITIRPRANASGTIVGVLTVAGNNTPTANLQGTASNFTCRGEVRDGGTVVSCNNVDVSSSQPELIWNISNLVIFRLVCVVQLYKKGVYL